MAVTVGSKEYVEAQQTLNGLASRAAEKFHLQTPAQKAQQTAYNEFIADYVDRHGECKATRDEAHEVAEWIETMAKDVASLCEKYSSSAEIAGDAADDLADDFIYYNGDIDGKDEAKFLAVCAIAAALEVVG